MGESETTRDAGIFAIAADNKRMHLYVDLADLHTSIQSVTTAALEFYDVHGSRLAPAFSAKWTLDSLRPVDQPDEELVRRRLMAVMGQLQDDAERQAQELRGIGAVPNGAPLLPDITHDSLPDCFTVLMKAGLGHREPSIERTDLRDFWHNFWAHGLR